MPSSWKLGGLGLALGGSGRLAMSGEPQAACGRDWGMSSEGGERYRQGDYVRDFVFPLALATWTPDGSLRYERYCGTAFFIGRQGFALTAAHVVRDLESGPATLVGLFAARDCFRAFAVKALECHPTEDVAVLRMIGEPWDSPFHVFPGRIAPSAEYHLWGYPADGLLYDAEGKETPDLIYFKGYVRRVLHRRIPGMIGTHFFELSQPAYCGCSGGPLSRIGPGGVWHLLGIYVGFRRAVDPDAPFLSVGYGLHVAAFRDWEPAILGRALGEEAAEGSLHLQEFTNS